MKLIGPRLQHDVHHGPTSSNVGAEVVGLHFEFLDGVDRGLDDFDSNLLFVVVEAVQKKIVVGGSEPVHLNGGIAPLIFRDASLLHGETSARPLVDARRQIGQFHEVSSIQRQVVYL